MPDVWLQVGLVALLIVVNAAFAGTELALVSLRKGQLQRLEQRSSAGATLAQVARRPNQFFATIQIGITLAGFLASAAAAVSLAEPVEQWFSFLGDAAGPVSVIAVTLVLAYFTLVFGELAPKRVAMQKAERWGLIMARPLQFLSALTRPVVWLLSRPTDLVVRMIGGDPSVQREEVTEEELRELVDTQPNLTDEQRRIARGAFEIAERSLEEILVPRQSVFVIDASWPSDEAATHLLSSGHNRAPVADDRNLDQVLDVVHLRQLLGAGSTPASNEIDKIQILPESANALSALQQLQAGHVQMALVVDQYGGAEGIVTVEDLLEEVVGDLHDAFDAQPVAATKVEEGTYLLPGRFPVRGLADLDVDLPEGDYTTVAGLILDRMGRVPEENEQLTVGDWKMIIKAMQNRAITQVELHRVETYITEHLA